jgi:hypothetical protein
LPAWFLAEIPPEKLFLRFIEPVLLLLSGSIGNLEEGFKDTDTRQT